MDKAIRNDGACRHNPILMPSSRKSASNLELHGERAEQEWSLQMAGRKLNNCENGELQTIARLRVSEQRSRSCFQLRSDRPANPQHPEMCPKLEPLRWDRP